jgi:hypothetical protein
MELTTRFGPWGTVAAIPVTLAIKCSPGASRVPVVRTPEPLNELKELPKVKLNCQHEQQGRLKLRPWQ